MAEWLLIIKGRITGPTMNSKNILGLIALNYIMLPVYRDLEINTLEENHIGVKYL